MPKDQKHSANEPIIQLVPMLHLTTQCHLPLVEIHHHPQVFEDPQRLYGTPHCTGKLIGRQKIVGCMVA